MHETQAIRHGTTVGRRAVAAFCMEGEVAKAKAPTAGGERRAAISVKA